MNQAIAAAATALYAALEAEERRLSSLVDASASREAMRLTNTRLSIQKLMGVYVAAPVPKFEAPSANAVPVGQMDRQPPTPGGTLAAKKPKGRR